MNFSSFGLHARVAAGVSDQGYTEPTPIQKKAIPEVLRGRDVLGLAQTGTGKTAAFALPILERLLDGPRGRVRALIVAPTRELALQIHVAFSELGSHTGLRSTPVFGGVNANPQIRALGGRAEIVVACPGRLLDHLQQETADLSSVEVLVLDEADRLFDMGFLPDVRRIIRHLPPARQNLLFSATMPPDIRRLANEVLVDPVTVQVDYDRPAETVSHAVFHVDERGKGEALLQLLYDTDTESVLVFTRTKHRAKRVSTALGKAGFRASCLQGNLSQTRRQEALDGFRSGHYQILVATDIAARGIDVSTISHVINYDMPDTVDAYTHRIGRTGRAARSGDAFTLVTPADRPAVRAIEKMMGTRIAVRQLAHAGRKPEQRPAASSNQPTVGVQRSVRDGDPGEPSRRPRRTRRPRPRGATGAPIRRHGPASEGAEVRGDGRERAGRRPGSASRSRHPSSQPAAGPRRRSWKRRTASARS